MFGGRRHPMRWMRCPHTATPWRPGSHRRPPRPGGRRRRRDPAVRARRRRRRNPPGEPRLIAFNAYVNDVGNQVAIALVHPDVDSMEFHVKVIREHVEHAAWEFLGDTVSEHIYGAARVAWRTRNRAMPGRRLLASCGVEGKAEFAARQQPRIDEFEGVPPLDLLAGAPSPSPRTIGRTVSRTSSTSGALAPGHPLAGILGRSTPKRSRLQRYVGAYGLDRSLEIHDAPHDVLGGETSELIHSTMRDAICES
jgi:hypothetical protein